MRELGFASARAGFRKCESWVSNCLLLLIWDTTKVVNDAKKVMLGKIKSAFSDITDGSVLKMRVADAVKKAREAEEQSKIDAAVAAAKLAAEEARLPPAHGFLGRFL